jgi:hypothetical protein
MLKVSRTFWLIFFLVLATVSGIWTTLLAKREVVLEERVTPSSSGNPIRALFVLPWFKGLPKDRSHPAVVAIPPYSIPPEAMEIICVELARKGVACAIPDFYGKTPEESRQRMGEDSLRIMTLDVLSILNSLRALPWVDPKRLGTCGHSVGGTVAFLAGLEDPSIRAVVLIGMDAEIHAEGPQNLLFLSGFYDEMRSPTSLLERFEEDRVSVNPQINTLYGEFARGTARQITITPTCDHFIETFDPWLIGSLLKWYGAAFDIPELGQGMLREWWRRITLFCCVFSATIVYIMLMSRATHYIIPKLVSGLFRSLFLHAQPVPVVIVLWGLGTTFAIIRPIAANLMLSLLLAHSVVTFSVNQRQKSGPHSAFTGLRSGGFALLALGVAMLLTWFIMSLPNYVRFPEMILWYPVFIINAILLFPIEIWDRIIPWLFADQIVDFVPNGLYAAFLCFAVVFPDLPMRLLNRIAEGSVGSIKRRLRPGSFPRFKRLVSISNLSPPKIVLFIVLWGALVFLLYRRATEGMLTRETALFGALILVRFAFLPFFITWLIIRTTVFQRISGLSDNGT